MCQKPLCDASLTRTAGLKYFSKSSTTYHNVPCTVVGHKFTVSNAMSSIDQPFNNPKNNGT